MSRNRWRTPSAFEMNASLRGPGSMTTPSSGTRTVQEAERTTRASRSSGPPTRRAWRVGSPCLVWRTSAWRNPHASHSTVVWSASPKYGMSMDIERILRGSAPHIGQGALRATSRTGDGLPFSGTPGQGGRPALTLDPRRARARFKYELLYYSIQLQVD